LPQLTAGGQQAMDLFSADRPALSFAKASDVGLNLYALAKNILPPTSKQQQAYQYFKALMENKILMSAANAV